MLFQPHLFSRTRDFAEGFAAALSAADGVRVLPVYPAREEPVEGVDSSLITRRLTADLPGADEVAPDAQTAVAGLVSDAREGDVILTMGAGDVTAQGEHILTALAQRGRDGADGRP